MLKLTTDGCQKSQFDQTAYRQTKRLVFHFPRFIATIHEVGELEWCKAERFLDAQHNFSQKYLSHF